MPRRGNRFDVPIGEAPADEHGLWERVAPLIEADLAGLTGPPLRVSVVADDDDPTSAHLEVRHPDGYVVPIFVEVGDDEGEAAVEAFRAVLESAVFDDTFNPWPRCPRHPDAGHSLAPALRRGQAVWECPTDRAVMSKIGSLRSTER